MSNRYEHDADTSAQDRTESRGPASEDGKLARADSNAAERHAEPPRSSPPPRGPKLWVVVSVLLALLSTMAVGIFFGDAIRAGLGRFEEAVLVGEEHDHTEDDGQYWTCGMHPWVILPEPGLCPICHMDLTPLDTDKLSGEILIDPVVVQNIGVRVAPVTAGSLEKEVRTVGTVVYNEEAVRVVNTKVGGWVEELYVDETGVLVANAQPLFELYSPELFAAQQEYLSAYRNRTLPGGEELLQASRTRLEYFDVSEEQIQRLQETGEPRKTLTITSPHAGVVTEKAVSEGMRIDPGTRVYQIADLSTVWVQATVYEQDLPYVQMGQKATMTLPYLPGQRFEGEVAYIYPYLNEGARQVRARLEFPNPEGLLKPGMFATVRLEQTLDEDTVLVPRDAVVTTGERDVVFVSLGEGRFEPREVDLGIEAENGLVEVLEGLEPREQVVVSGQFMLDSENKMRLALAKMIEGNLATEQEPMVPMAEANVLPALPDPAAASLTGALDAYFAMGDALEEDSLDGVDEQAQAVTASLEALTQTRIPDRPDFWEELQGVFDQARQGAHDVAETSDLEAARFAYAVLSDALDRLLLATGVPLSYEAPVHRFVCGFLGDAPRRGIWLQPGGEPSNPLMGEASGMLECQIPADHRVLPTTGSFGGSPQPATPRPRPTAQTVPDKQVTLEPLSADAAQALQNVLAAYGAVGDKLVAKSTAGIAADAQRVVDAFDELQEAATSDESDVWAGGADVATARAAALELADANDVAAARLVYADLSHTLTALLERTGAPPFEGEAVAVFTCPMFPPGGDGAVWLQPAGPPRNPYMGEGPMLQCTTGSALLPPFGGEKATPAVEDAGEAIPAAAVPDELRAGAGRLIDRYLAIHQALSLGEPAKAGESLQTLRMVALELAEAKDAEVRSLAKAVADEAVPRDTHLPALRASFKSLSEAVIDLIERVPPTTDQPLYRGYCAMSEAAWLQIGTEVKNPYYGDESDMYGCGELEPLLR